MLRRDQTLWKQLSLSVTRQLRASEVDLFNLTNVNGTLTPLDDFPSDIFVPTPSN